MERHPMADEISKELPIEWHIPDGMTGRHATNIVVQYVEGEYVVSFFELVPPIVLGEPEERLKQIEQLTSVRAQCVARIVVPAHKMEGFIGAFVQTFTNVTSRMSEQEEPANQE
jgi:hypothetical protein